MNEELISKSNLHDPHLHCYHDDGVVLTSYPPQIPETCCWCGETRTQPFDITDRGHHGPFKAPGGITWDASEDVQL